MSVNRLWATRLAAPAAFLLGITVAVLLVRAGLDGGEATTTGAQTATPTTVRTATGATAPTATQPPPEFVRIEAGDTLDAIALEHDTTVEALLTLNPGLDPNGLQVGQRVRVR